MRLCRLCNILESVDRDCILSSIAITRASESNPQHQPEYEHCSESAWPGLLWVVGCQVLQVEGHCDTSSRTRSRANPIKTAKGQLACTLNDIRGLCCSVLPAGGVARTTADQGGMLRAVVTQLAGAAANTCTGLLPQLSCLQARRSFNYIPYVSTCLRQLLLLAFAVTSNSLVVAGMSN
jgi:hypothetical protein